MKPQDTQYTDDELALMRGEDLPADEPDTIEAQAAPAAEYVDPDLEGEGTTDGPATDEAPATEAAAQEEPEAAFVPQFDGSLPADYEANKAALRAEKVELRTQWSNGDLSDDEYAAAEAKLEDRFEALMTDAAAAKALQRANEQMQAQKQAEAAKQAQATLKSISEAAKTQGIDYTDEGMAVLYDAKLRQVGADPAFKGKPFAEVAQEAHNRVAQLMGKATPTHTKADGARPNARASLPQTLANLPAAAALPVGQDLDSQLDAIDDPDVLEAKWASLPTAQRQSMLRSTLPQPRRR